MEILRLPFRLGRGAVTRVYRLARRLLFLAVGAVAVGTIMFVLDAVLLRDPEHPRE